MYDQTEVMRSQIKSVIRDYESLFSESNPMPEHRAQDVVDLRMLLDNTYDDLNSCITTLKHRLSLMKTGWWIFRTGHSRLRNGIYPILRTYENPITQHLMAQIAWISYSFCEAVKELNQLKQKTASLPHPVPKNSVSDSVPIPRKEPAKESIKPQSQSVTSFSVEDVQGDRGIRLGRK